MHTYLHLTICVDGPTTDKKTHWEYLQRCVKGRPSPRHLVYVNKFKRAAKHKRVIDGPSVLMAQLIVLRYLHCTRLYVRHLKLILRYI